MGPFRKLRSETEYKWILSHSWTEYFCQPSLTFFLKFQVGMGDERCMLLWLLLRAAWIASVTLIAPLAKKRGKNVELRTWPCRSVGRELTRVSKTRQETRQELPREKDWSQSQSHVTLPDLSHQSDCDQRREEDQGFKTSRSPTGTTGLPS